jgi:hypothetical protein
MFVELLSNKCSGPTLTGASVASDKFAGRHFRIEIKKYKGGVTSRCTMFIPSFFKIRLGGVGETNKIP